VGSKAIYLQIGKTRSLGYSVIAAHLKDARVSPQIPYRRCKKFHKITPILMLIYIQKADNFFLIIGKLEV